MKKISVFLSLCCVLLLGVVLTQTANETTVPVTEPLTAEQQQPAPEYIVRVQNGMLVICPYGSDNPAEVTDIRLSSLREYDQQLMQKGFPIYSDEELTAFLEDFGS